MEYYSYNFHFDVSFCQLRMFSSIYYLLQQIDSLLIRIINTYLIPSLQFAWIIFIIEIREIVYTLLTYLHQFTVVDDRLYF